MSTLSSTDAVIVELVDNPLTQRTDDRYGRVINIASVDVETLIARAIANGYNGNLETMKADYQAIKGEALKSVVRGEINNFGLTHNSIGVNGPFLGDAPVWNPEVNSLVPRSVASKEWRELLKNTPVKVIGMAPDQAAISTVTDVATGKVNEWLTPGGMANVKGSRIRIAGDKPGIGLFLANQDTQKVIEVPANSIGLNDPSTIMFVVPVNIEVGNYLLSIVTQFSAHKSHFLNDPRTITLHQLLTVG
jgi:hypothetical protein